MRRPIVLIAISWLSGAYMSLASDSRWSVVVVSLLFMIWLILAVKNNTAITLCISCILIVLFSAAYNTWFDLRNSSQFQDRYPLALSGDEWLLEGVIISSVEVDGDRISFVLREPFSEKLQVFLRVHSLQEKQQAEKWQRGDHVLLPGTLSRPEPARNFDSFEYSSFLRLQKIHWIMNVDGLEQVSVRPNTARGLTWLLRGIDQLRKALSAQISLLFSSEYEGYMQSLLIGVRDHLQPEQFEQFSKLGLSHIIAISGLHVGIFVAACMGLLRWTRLTKEKRMMLTLCLIPIYILLTGAAPSVIRAGLMAMLALFCMLQKKLKDGLNIISIVGTGMLIIHPYYLFQISFQLSFIVTLGLIIAVPIFNQWLAAIRSKGVRSSLSVMLVAQIVSFPLAIYYFNQFSLLSWLANLWFVPIISLCVIPLGMLALILSFVSRTLASLLAQCIDGINKIIFTIVEWMNGFSALLLYWPSPSHLWILLFYTLFAALLWLFSKENQSMRRGMPTAICCGLFTILLLYGYTPGFYNSTGMVQFIDVGQGDAILVRTPERKYVLLDGGGTLSYAKHGEEWRKRNDPYEVGKNVLVPLLKKRGVHKLDMVMLSHADIDHYGGLQAVLEHFPVKKVVFSGALNGAAPFVELLHTIIAANVPIQLVHAGDQLQIDSHTTLSFLYPQELPKPMEISDHNRLSLVSLLEIYDSRFLLAGDIDQSVELELMQHLQDNKFDPKADVLKVAHHGSRFSTSDLWLSYWQPRMSVISAGRYNLYGHPHPTVLDRLQVHGSMTLRTDLHGEVQFEVLPDALQFRTKLPWFDEQMK